MAHANFVSSIRLRAYLPLIWTKNNKHLFPTFRNVQKHLKQHINIFSNLSIYTENDTEAHRIIQNINTYSKTHTTQHENQLAFYFLKLQNPLFQKYKFKNSTCYVGLYGIIHILRWGPHSLTSCIFLLHLLFVYFQSLVFSWHFSLLSNLVVLPLPQTASHP